MKRIIVLTICMVLMSLSSSAQSNREKRLMLNEYVSPEELVSMSKTLQFDKAMLLFSEFSKKYMNKIIVDVSNNKKPIGVDVENTYWYQAFENILRSNGLWYDEREEFYYVYSPVDSQKVTSGPVGAAGSVAAPVVDTTGKMLLRQRDVRISSVFFTVDVLKSLDAGINWSFFYSGDTAVGATRRTQFGADFIGGASAGSGFAATVIPAIKFSNVSALISFFQNNKLGDVLSGPSVVVSSGKQGKIQVGQDIFLTTKDFAGNTIQTPISSGIIIDVKPTVYDEKGIKFINLDIKAENSFVLAGPVIKKSTATTFSVLYDGEEMVIGGLYTNSETSERGGVPFLKDLPWWVFGLKYLFGFDKTTTTTSELIILLKAEIIPTVEERVAAAAQKKGINIIEQTRLQNAGEIERLKPKK